MRKKNRSGDTYRFYPIPPLASNPKTEYRSEYDRDYARVLHSPSFRRLQNKTQLFPGQESDFFRNRLTHSLEVSQIAYSIASKVKTENPRLNVIPEVCRIAGLVHDIGHPPFGHNGERALDECMRQFGGFEGNAQTFRILTRLEKKEYPRNGKILSDTGDDCRVGLNLTARVLASSLKYDHKISTVRKPDAPLEKGYYGSEEQFVTKIKKCLNWESGPFKTIECAIMDLADDIAYSTYDVEDAFKAGFLTPYEMLCADEEIYEKIVDKLAGNDIKATAKECRTILYGVFEEMFQEIWDPPTEELRESLLSKDDEQFKMKTLEFFTNSYRKSKEMSVDGYWRTKLTSGIVNMFINGIELEPNPENTALSSVHFNEETLLRVNVLKHFSYVALISSPRLKVAESRGGEIITKMFNKLSEDGGQLLLPEDTKRLFHMSEEELWHKRVVCDFIAGMTDRYAIEFYGRLFSENPQTIFKPLD